MCDKKRIISDRKARQPSVKVALDSRGHCDICSYNIIAFRDKLIKLIRNIWPNWFDLINWIELNLALSIYHIQTSFRKSARSTSNHVTGGLQEKFRLTPYQRNAIGKAEEFPIFLRAPGNLIEIRVLLETKHSFSCRSRSCSFQKVFVCDMKKKRSSRLVTWHFLTKKTIKPSTSLWFFFSISQNRYIPLYYHYRIHNPSQTMKFSSSNNRMRSHICKGIHVLL